MGNVVILEKLAAALKIALHFNFVDFFYWLLDFSSAVKVSAPFCGTAHFRNHAAVYELAAPTPQGSMVAERIAIVFVVQFQSRIPWLVLKALNVSERGDKASELFRVDLDADAIAAVEDFRKALCWRLRFGKNENASFGFILTAIASVFQLGCDITPKVVTIQAHTCNLRYFLSWIKPQF